MSQYAEFWEGVEACRRGDKCPETASQPFQRGFGMEYAAQEAKPPIDLDKFEEQFQEVFK